MRQAAETDQALLLADLSGYTALTETHGALQASEIIQRFGRLAEASGSAPAIAIDPVCRMQVASGCAAATIAYGSTLYRFCSQACARVFAAAPERFIS